MATITTAQAGNWSDVATWTGGVVPGINDVASLSHIVTLNANASVNSVVSTGVGGGLVSSTVRTLSVTQFLTMSVTSTTSLVEITGGALTLTVGAAVTVGAHTGSATAIVNVVGGAVNAIAPSWTCDTASAGTEPSCFRFATGTNGAVTGDIIGGTTSTSYGIYTFGSSIVVVNGNVLAGTTNDAHGVCATGTSNVTVNGNVTGMPGGASGVYANDNTVITINGNVATTSGTGTGVKLVNSAAVTVNGNVASGVGSGQAINAIDSTAVTVRGHVTGGTVAAAIGGTRPVRVGRVGETSVLSGLTDPIDNPWVVVAGATVKIIRPDDSMWPLLTGTPIDHMVQDPYNPTLADFSSVMGALLAAALDHTPPATPK